MVFESGCEPWNKREDNRKKRMGDVTRILKSTLRQLSIAEKRAGIIHAESDTLETLRTQLEKYRPNIRNAIILDSKLLDIQLEMHKILLHKSRRSKSPHCGIPHTTMPAVKEVR